MATTTKPLDLQGLQEYREKNPVKFLHKYGEVDFNNLPVDFDKKFTQYKALVVKERIRRAEQGLPENDPAITPWTIFPRPVAPAPVIETKEIIPETVTTSENVLESTGAQDLQALGGSIEPVVQA